MIRIVKNDGVASRADVAIGRGPARRLDVIHVHRRGTPERHEIVLSVYRDNRPTDIILQAGAAAELRDALAALLDEEPGR